MVNFNLAYLMQGGLNHVLFCPWRVTIDARFRPIYSIEITHFIKDIHVEIAAERYQSQNVQRIQLRDPALSNS